MFTKEESKNSRRGHVQSQTDESKQRSNNASQTSLGYQAGGDWPLPAA